MRQLREPSEKTRGRYADTGPALYGLHHDGADGVGWLSALTSAQGNTLRQQPLDLGERHLRLLFRLGVRCKGHPLMKAGSERVPEVGAGRHGEAA